MKFTPIKDFDQYRAGQTYTDADDAKVRQWIDEGKVREAGGSAQAGADGAGDQARGQVGAMTTGRDAVTGADPNEGPRDSVTGARVSDKPGQPTGGQTKK